MVASGGKKGQPRLVSVNLAGSSFKIRTDASQDYVTRLERYVNEKIVGVQGGGRQHSIRTALALAALSIADDYFTASESRDELDQEVRERLRRVLERVDAALESE